MEQTKGKIFMRAVYPGSFDPTTYGHLDIIERAANIVDELIVAPLINFSKEPAFTVDERCRHLEILTADMKNVRVEPFDGLLVNFMHEKKASIIIRGLRAVTDFEYEFQMSLVNRNLAKDVETLFISTSLRYLYLSSSTVKEVAMLGGDISKMVPQPIVDFVIDKFKPMKK